MELRFTPLSLAGLGALETEVLCLPLFSDERPLRGAIGLIDWRLCGRLSELLVNGTLVGSVGEALLMPPPERRLSAERLLIIGAGPRADFDCRAHLRRTIARVLALRVRTAAFALPHASVPWLAPEDAIDLLLEACADKSEVFDEVVVVDTPSAQRAMEPRIEYARRRALAEM